MKTFIGDFDDEVHVDLLGVEMLNQLVGGFGSTTSSQEVVVYENYIIAVDGVEVHFNGINAILFRERLLNHRCRQLTWLTCQHYTAALSTG